MENYYSTRARFAIEIKREKDPTKGSRFVLVINHRRKERRKEGRKKERSRRKYNHPTIFFSIVAV